MFIFVVGWCKRKAKNQVSKIFCQMEGLKNIDIEIAALEQQIRKLEADKEALIPGIAAEIRQVHQVLYVIRNSAYTYTQSKHGCFITKQAGHEYLTAANIPIGETGLFVIAEATENLSDELLIKLKV